MRKFLVAMLVIVCFVSTAVAAIPVEQFIRSTTVQVVVNMSRYSRNVTWYQEVDANGNRGEWKERYGDWSKEPELVTAVGSGVILYSGKDKDATYILTNAHVVDTLVRKESLGSRAKPLEVFKDEDKIEHSMPPRLKIREDARPIGQEYYVLDTNYVAIKHRKDQQYEVRGKVVAFDMALDVALIEVSGVYGLPYASFRDTPTHVGEEVFICGAPLGIPFSLDKGRVNQVELDLGAGGGIVWDDQIKLDIAAAPGSSGSGVFDLNGDLVAEYHGILVYHGNYIHGSGLAINGQTIKEWLTWTGWSFIVNQEPYRQEVSVAEGDSE